MREVLQEEKGESGGMCGSGYVGCASMCLCTQVGFEDVDEGEPFCAPGILLGQSCMPNFSVCSYISEGKEIEGEATRG